MKQSHGYRYLGGTIAVILALLVAGTPALGKGPNGELDQDSWQASVESLINELSALGNSDADFAVVGPDYAKRTVVVYRKHGKATARYRSARVPAGVAVEIRPALLSARESNGLMDEVMAARPALLGEGITVTGASTEWTGPVTIHVLELTAAARSLADRFNRYGPGTVRVEQGNYVQPVTRFNDYPPFFGGDRVNSAGGTLWTTAYGFMRCTTGFGGRSAGNGMDYVLIAYHCVQPADPRFWIANEAGDAGGSFVGQATVLDRGHDLAYVRSSTLPNVWDGPIYPDSAQFTKQVTAMAKPALQARVCTSGSFSGARCYATVRGGGHYTLCGFWAGQGCWDAFLWYADSDAGTPMCQSGDSGGPVFTPHSNTVTAVGIISAGNVDYAGNLICSRVFFPDIYTEAWLNHQIDLTQ